MFENLRTPEEVFSFKLGSLLQAEQDTLDLLQSQIAAAHHTELKELLTQHLEETRQQVSNIEQCFSLLGESVDTNASPVSKGLAKESAASLKKTDDSIVDAVIIAGTLETEYIEQAQYTVLVANADARGAHDVKALLEQNLAQEVAMGEKIKKLGWRLAHEGYTVNAASEQENRLSTETVDLSEQRTPATVTSGTSTTDTTTTSNTQQIA
jgi:ferritin-like metal-binding protein YciE